MEKDFPEEFKSRMLETLGPEEYGAFIGALSSPSPVSIRINPLKINKDALPGIEEEVPWCRYGYYLQSRPVFTLDPLLHGGAYYVQEASSMFISFLLSGLPLEKGIRVLDMCASPGGKSTLLSSELPEGSLLVSNEFVKSRVGILKENMIKWGGGNGVITSSDAAAFGKCGPVFDLILVDAPCSGEGMFRKDDVAIEEWSGDNLKMCEQRQRYILTEVWKALKPGGYMIYSTCTFNPDENIRMLEFMEKDFGASSVDMHPPFEGIKSYAAPYGYSFMPHRLKGEGFFAGVLRKDAGEDGPDFATGKRARKSAGPRKSAPSRELQEMVKNMREYEIYAEGEVWGVVPAAHAAFIDTLSKTVKVQYKGCELMQVMGHKMKPLPASAFFQDLERKNFCVAEVDRMDALKFLKREDIEVDAPEGKWVLVSYRGVGLGWGKKLSNRLNNNYPKNWMIRMSINI